MTGWRTTHPSPSSSAATPRRWTHPSLGRDGDTRGDEAGHLFLARAVANEAHRDLPHPLCRQRGRAKQPGHPIPLRFGILGPRRFKIFDPPRPPAHTFMQVNMDEGVRLQALGAKVLM